MRFAPSYSSVSTQIAPQNAAQIEQETMLFGASFHFARARGGVITLNFLETLRVHAESIGLAIGTVIVDSRIHTLMRGMYPCIPGWHHDDVPRGEFGQPNYDDPRYRSHHLMMVVDADDAPTGSLPQFLCDHVDVDWPLPFDAVVYRAWDAQIGSLPSVKTETIRSGQAVAFDDHAFHRGMPAKSHGWRFFIRASWSTGRAFQNKIRHNANVYLPAVTAGW